MIFITPPMSRSRRNGKLGDIPHCNNQSIHRLSITQADLLTLRSLNKKMRRYMKMIKSQQRQTQAPTNKAKSSRMNIVDWDSPSPLIIPAIRALQQ